MNDELLPALLRAFDVCVVECLPGPSEPHGRQPDAGPAVRHSVLRLLSPAPDWLASAFAAAPGDVPTLGDTFPFLDHFLRQAEDVWHEGHPASASSELFAATVNGADLLLRAVAIAQHEHRLIVLQRLTGDADVRPMLQRAREQTLELERVVRRVGSIHGPAVAIERDVKALQAAALSPEHHALVERLSQSAAEVQAVLATLPAPPRQRRQARPQ